MRSNTDEKKVLDAKVFAFYKGTLVIKLPKGWGSFSFGIIFISNDVRSTDTVKHEYGHKRQLEELGFWKYLTKYFYPSVKTYHTTSCGRDLGDAYYLLPWEFKANELGGVAFSYDVESKRKSDEYWHNALNK